jgi:antitoxin YefM
MTIQTTYTQARDGLAELLNQVTHNREVVVIHRRGEEEVAMIAASELESASLAAELMGLSRNGKQGPELIPVDLI